MTRKRPSRILTKLKDNFELKYFENPVSENSDTGFFMVKFL
jgi:hypothetical protein